MRLKVNHRLAAPVYYDYFNKFNFSLRYDAIASAFTFEYYFDPLNQEHAELFAVSHYHEAIIEHNGETLLTGFIVSQKFKSNPQKNLAMIGGYSKTGVLEDCEIPPALYPLQSNGLNLEQIANKICAKFRINVVVDKEVSSKMSKAIKSTIAEHTDSIKNYLSKLTIQRKIVITHNEFGDLVFTEAKTNKEPIFDVIQGTIGTEMELMFDGQKLHSDITVMKESGSGGGNAGQYTIENPFVPVAYTYRPRVVTQSSGDENTIQEYAKQILATEIKSAITLTITTDRWEINGKIIKPNNTIWVENPEIFIYKKTKWFIEEITFTGDEKKTTAVLKCVLPCSYDNSTPENIFIEPHENFPRYNYDKFKSGLPTSIN